MIAVALAISNGAFAKSNPPSPSPRESCQPQQTQSQTTQQPPAADQRGTQQSPLIIKTLPTTKTEEETAQEAGERNQKTSTDRRLIVIGALQLVVFIGQLLVFGYQAWKLRQTVMAAETQRTDMLRSIEATEKMAIATQKVAEAAESAAAAAIKTAEAANEQVSQLMSINWNTGVRNRITGD